MTMTHDVRETDIAIIGMSCRFPGANSLESFWWSLREGLETIARLSQDELERSAIDRLDTSDPNFVGAASMLDDVDWFDAPFFGIPAREAEVMDPQHRVFLECAWHALEHAGYDPSRYADAIGVYAGARTNTYLFNLFSNRDALSSLDAFEVGLGNDLSFLSSRVSHRLGLRGPSYSIQTACSTSLVAVHLACQSLLINECQLALAGGVAINVPQKTGYLYRRAGILSPDGHCRAFDADAQGTVFGSGIGVVVLKRALDAVADGDTIHALIKGSAVNNDGSLKAGFTAPSVTGQAAVISEALANAGVEPDTIGYVEAHGTGTPLGDPIEIRALTKAYRARTAQRQYCAIGSVKTNVGHLDAASGIAGLIKTVLALEQGSLPPSLHFVQPNPQIDFASSPFYVNDRLRAWPAAASPRRAAVSAFGVGGTNAHVIVEEAPTVPAAAPSRPWQLLMLSSKSATALETATGQLVRHLREQPDVCLADVAYTLAVGRGQFEHRKIVACQDVDDAVAALVNNDPMRVRSHAATQSERPVVFMFPGQGAQRVNMGRALYEQEPGFRTPFDRCAAIVHEALGLDLAALIYPTADLASAAVAQLAQTWVTQPALFVVEYALAQLWRSWGIEPAALIGHSVGEYVAACLAGVFDLDTALRLVIARGQLMQAAPPGAMLAVSLSEAEARGLTSASLSVAAINGPTQCVLAGTLEAVAALEQRLGTEGIGCRRLHTSHAFHSALMDPVVAPFGAAVARVPRQAPRLRWISNVTGQWMREADATDPAYWARHLREPVRLHDGLTTITTEGRPVLLEVGPGDVLSRCCRALPSPTPLAIVTSLPNEKPDTAPVPLQQSLGQLWLEGVAPDWSRYFAGEARRRIPLPTYPFERQRYWIEAHNAPAAQGQRLTGEMSNKKSAVADWFFVPSWKLEASAAADSPNDGVTCLVFLDQFGIGLRVCEQLERDGARVIRVETGAACSMEQLHADGNVPTRILHFCSLTTPDQASGHEHFAALQQLGYYSVLHTAQAFAQTFPASDVEIVVVTNSLVDVSGSERVLPEKAPMLAPAAVVPQENPRISVRVVDIELPSDESLTATTVNELLREVRRRSDEKLVALRGRSRWIRRYEPFRVDETSPGRRSLRERGVYLITGGLGGVGLLLAEHLARTVHARLVLTSRHGLPPKETWRTYIEELGGEVMTAAVDVSDEDAMRELVGQIHDRFGALHGVIHASGVTSGSSLYRSFVELGEAEAEEQFRPKVHGTYVLDKVLRGIPLDFCFLFSSNASVLGGLGYLTYAAANVFMDAFAAVASRRDAAWICANWDPWPQETKTHAALQTGVDVYAMTAEESTHAFEIALRQTPAGRLVVATGDFFARFDMWTRPQQPIASESLYARPEIETPYVPPETDVERALVALWQELLRIERVGIQDNFFDLGGHSLLAIRVMARVREQCAVDVSIAKFFEDPTVSGLAAAVALAQTEQVDPSRREVLQILETLQTQA